MAILEIPVVIDGVKSIEELANRVLDEYEFKGKTIREWADRIANPKTNGDRIRSMTNEELAHLLHSAEEHLFTGNLWNYEEWREWLKQEVTE